MRTCPVCGGEVKGRATKLYCSTQHQRTAAQHRAGERFWDALAKLDRNSALGARRTG